MLKKISQKIENNKRINKEEALFLLNNKDLLAVGRMATIIKERVHLDNLVTFVIDRNINYTNICTTKCRFCAFYRDKDNSEAYTLTQEEVLTKIKEAVSLNGTQIMLQGGLNPDLDLDYYISLLRSIKEKFSDIQIHSFSPPELIFFSKKFNLSIRNALKILKEAGLDSLPGGGAEILVDKVRKKISPEKISTSLWLKVMEEAHNLGMKTTATMMFGCLETNEDRVEHLDEIRRLQDKTGGFTAFIPWTFQAGHTELGGGQTSAIDYLKTLAVSRIYLDNIKNIQASWVTQGDKIGQLALAFGANDLGSIMLEENVVRATGVNFEMNKKAIVKIIKDAGFKAAQRTTLYNVIERFN